MMRGSKLDEILTLLFMILAVGAVVSFFALNSRVVFMYFGGAAVILRIVQYALRFFK